MILIDQRPWIVSPVDDAADCVFFYYFVFLQWDGETWFMLDGSSEYYGKVMEYPVNYGAAEGIFSDDSLGLPPAACPDWIVYLEMRWLGKPPCGRRTSVRVKVPQWTRDVYMRTRMDKKPRHDGWVPDYSGAMVYYS